jgi:hypothetical protein
MKNVEKSYGYLNFLTIDEKFFSNKSWRVSFLVIIIDPFINPKYYPGRTLNFVYSMIR